MRPDWETCDGRNCQRAGMTGQNMMRRGSKRLPCPSNDMPDAHQRITRSQEPSPPVWVVESHPTMKRAWRGRRLTTCGYCSCCGCSSFMPDRADVTYAPAWPCIHSIVPMVSIVPAKGQQRHAPARNREGAEGSWNEGVEGGLRLAIVRSCRDLEVAWKTYQVGQ